MTAVEAAAQRVAHRLVRELGERCGVVLDENAKAVIHDAVAEELSRLRIPQWAIDAYRRGLMPDPEEA